VRALGKLILLTGAALSAQPQTTSENAAAVHAKAAQEAQRRNDFATAVREYQQVVALFPQNAQAQSNLGIALYFNRQLRPALSTLGKAVTLDSTLFVPHLFSGLAWYQLSNPDAAVIELSKATQIQPADMLGHLWLGYAYVAQSRYELALKEFETAKQIDPANMDTWYALGQTYLETGRRATDRLLAAAPDGTRVWQLAGEQAELQGDRQRARENFENAFKRGSEIPEIRDAVARLGGNAQNAASAPVSRSVQEEQLYQEAHQAAQQARAAFEHVAQLAPDSYRAHQILGDSLTAQGRLEEANLEYRTVLLQKPDLPGVHQTIGENLLETGKMAEALEEFRAEIVLEPRSASALMRAGQALLLLGNDGEARNMLARAQTMDRPPAELYRLIGKLELRAKNYRVAVEALTHYTSIRKGDASAFYLLSKAYRGLNDRTKMQSALASFEHTSRDAKVRNQAQTELARFKAATQDIDSKSDLPQQP
jgi:tetratricopeptide (TPR) repeat protein